MSLRRAVSEQLHRVRPPLFPAQKRVVVNTCNSRTGGVSGYCSKKSKNTPSPDLKLSNEYTLRRSSGNELNNRDACTRKDLS